MRTDTKTAKGFWQGTQRTRSPADTFEVYKTFMPMMGITRLANVTGLDRIGLPVYISVRPNSRALSTSQGKGTTPEAAKTSALMESIETWHAERVSGPLIFESYYELKAKANVIDPNDLTVRSDAEFFSQRCITWMEGHDFFSDQPIWLPFESISINTVRQPNARPIFLGSSNGLASGNHISEAILHATCEVIERDALTLWDLCPGELREKRRVNLATISDSELENILNVLDRKGFAIAIWDITTDVTIPTFTCVLLEDPSSRHWRGYHMFSGHGTHLSPEIALSRAIHEAIQSRLTAISGTRDDFLFSEYSQASDVKAHGEMLDLIKMSKGYFTFGTFRPVISQTFEDDLDIVSEHLKRAGIMSLVVVDLTREDVKIPVVKVIIPGLEGPRLSFYTPGKRAERYKRNLGL